MTCCNKSTILANKVLFELSQVPICEKCGKPDPLKWSKGCALVADKDRCLCSEKMLVNTCGYAIGQPICGKPGFREVWSNRRGFGVWYILCYKHFVQEKKRGALLAWGRLQE